MQKVGHAVSKINIRHVKSPAHNAQHGVRTLRLHRTTWNMWDVLYATEQIKELAQRSSGNTGPRMHTCIFSEINLSSQPVSMLLCWKLSVSRSFMRYSTVVLKSPRIDNSFRATTILLKKIKYCSFIYIPVVFLENVCIVIHKECVHTKWLLPDSLPTRNSVRTVSQQTRANLQLLPRWSSPRRSYCCGNLAPVLFLNLVWNPTKNSSTHLNFLWTGQVSAIHRLELD